MWKIIGIPLLIYLIFVLYVYQPLSEDEARLARMLRQLPSETIKAYIEENAPYAVQEMERAKVPASITLAQAILESRYGTSELSIQGNNHFGIKADAAWKVTDRLCLHSDEWHEKRGVMVSQLSCFKKYASAQESFANHSDLLTTRSYYTELFKLDIYDYKAWAHGLKEAGYATDPQYAQKLIGLIELYQLYDYDK